MSTPTLFVPGIAKSGTTTLANFLESNFHVSFGRVKEPHYLLLRDNTEKYAKNYDSSFKGILADGSTGYAKNLMEVSKIYGEMKSIAGAELKIILIFRHPWYRLESHFLHLLRQGADCERIWAKREIKDSLAYGSILEVWRKVAAEGELVLLCLEDLLSNPVRVGHQLEQEIGVAKTNYTEFIIGKANAQNDLPILKGKVSSFIYRMTWSSSYKKWFGGRFRLIKKVIKRILFSNSNSFPEVEARVAVRDFLRKKEVIQIMEEELELFHSITDDRFAGVWLDVSDPWPLPKKSDSCK